MIVNGEVYRNLYLGKAGDCIHLYLGAESAKFAAFLYDKAGIAFETYKTDDFLNKDEFLYLVNAEARTFKGVGDFQEVTRLTRVLLDAYDVMKQYDFGNVNSLKGLRFTRTSLTRHEATASASYRVDSNSEALFTHENVYYSDELHRVFYNTNEKVAVFVGAGELPEYNDTVLTMTGWSEVAVYKASDIDDAARALLCGMLHGKKFEYDVVYKKLCAFKDFYA